MTIASTPTAVYERLIKTGTSPALVWYGPGERIELSGKVVANHIAKIANYLTDEVDLIPGARVVFDLPAHWKTVVWGIAAMISGGNVVVGRNRIRDAEPHTIVVTNEPRPAEYEKGDTVVALTMGSLAFEWDGELPGGVYDGAADVLGFPDSLMVSGLDDESNAGFYANVIEDRPETPRIAVSFPGPTALLSLAFQAFANGQCVVAIADPNKEVTAVCAAEGAEYFSDFHRYDPM